MIDEICLGVDLVESLEPSSSGMAVVVPGWLSRNSTSLMNYFDCILLMSFPGMGEGLHQLLLVEARR